MLSANGVADWGRMTPIRAVWQIASKNWRADASAWRRHGYGQQDVSADDWLIIEEASEQWKIQRGEQYRKLVYKDGGEFVSVQSPDLTWTR